MRNRASQSAGVLVALGLFLVLQVLYILFGTVDIVYVHGEKVVCRQDDVCALSPIDNPIDNMDDETYAEYKDAEFCYSETGEAYVYGESMFDLRVRIGIKAIYNLYSFRWSEVSKPIVIAVVE